MIRPTFMAFETAKKALSASQYGLDTVGHNISNINTLGYTRQRVDQVSISANSSRTKFVLYGARSHMPGMGSEVTGINQIRDPYLDKRYRSEAATAGEYNAISNDLSEINKIFDEIVTTGSHEKMSEFLSALQKLIDAADSAEHATVLRNKAEQMAKMLNENSKKLDDVEQQIRQELNACVTDVNSILEQIAMLNQKIKEDHFYGNPANELMDERNLLIDQLSEYIDIEIENVPIKLSNGSTLSQLKISIKNSGNVARGIEPVVLVDGGNYNGISTDYDETTGEATIRLTDGSDLEIKMKHADGSISSDISGYLFTGALKGHLSVLNGKGTYAVGGENGFRGIPYYRQALDDYAATLAGQMNKFNELAVYCPNGPYIDPVTGEAVTIERNLFTSKDGGPVTAASICVTDEWLQNPQYINNAVKNNALYVSDDGFVYLTDDGNGDMERTQIHISQISGINKDGLLLDANGNFLDKDGFATNNLDNAVNLSALQRAMTEDTTYYPFNLEDYIIPEFAADGTTPNSRWKEIAIKEGNGYTAPDITISANVPPGLTAVTPDDVYMDANDILRYKANNLAVEVMVYDSIGNGTLKNVTKDMLYKSAVGEAGVDYVVGQPTPNELLPGPAKNDNLLAIKDMLNSKSMTYSTYGVGNGFTGSFQEYLTGMQGDMAGDLQLNDAMLDASLSVLMGLADSRDAISGVSVDEEGISMMTYQNYYNAAARYMTVLDEALGTIIQGMGVVGR